LDTPILDYPERISEPVKLPCNTEEIGMPLGALMIWVQSGGYNFE
jgi:hypothetical protein